MTNSTKSGKNFSVGSFAREVAGGVFKEVALPTGGKSRMMDSDVFAEAVQKAGKSLAASITESRKKG
ncbi:hypothetical protein [Pinisolibacter sp.]|uniref:hypothetical protein n=1 Tax=Pinisolibacter sp. TaxID=2172024 RepID=UPI002FDCA2E4